MRNAKLAEAVILQAIDDLFVHGECDNSVEFFAGNGFNECAEMAGMDYDRKMGVLNVVRTALGSSISMSMRAFGTGNLMSSVVRVNGKIQGIC